MTDVSITLYVSSHDLEVGLAKRDCPTCRSPLLLRLPSMGDAVRSRGSSALALGLDGLTGRERALFDAVYATYPRAIAVDDVAASMYVGKRSLEPMVYRLRRKLLPLGWRLIQRNSALRLIAPEVGRTY